MATRRAPSALTSVAGRYEAERAARERRAEILEQQRRHLLTLRRLVEDTSAFNGHALFVEDGFSEGLTY